jgi:transposase
MTTTNASPPARSRRVKFTPQAIEKIKELVAEGLSRDEIANRLGVTEGSLQVTCSRLELFRPTAQGATRPISRAEVGQVSAEARPARLTNSV